VIEQALQGATSECEILVFAFLNKQGGVIWDVKCEGAKF